MIAGICGGWFFEGSTMLTIYPTDTVWGLGASVYSREENEMVRLLKGNELDKPLSVLFYDLDHLRDFLTLPPAWDDDDKLKAFFEWEGTLALPRNTLKSDWGDWIYAKSVFATVRCLPLDFLRWEGVPFSTTSLNYQGEEPATTLADARAFAQTLDVPHRLIPDKSLRPSGMASTIFALHKDGRPECWRQGRFYSEIVKAFG